METLTDLEAAALGCVFTHKHCTAHFVRTQFRVSPSARFSDSAGSVYPMMRRLEKRELLSSEVTREGRRDVRNYSATSLGRQALKHWLGPPIQETSLLTIDPLRTRMLSLELLTPRRRVAWLREAEDALLELLTTITDPAGTSNHLSIFVQLANDNARRETEARLAWIESARRRLTQADLI